MAATDFESVRNGVKSLHYEAASKELELQAGVVHRFVAQRVPVHADAQDIAQQALLRAWINLNKYRGGDFRAWVLAIARRLVVDHFRAQRRISELEGTPSLKAESELTLQSGPELIQIVCDCRARLRSWRDCLTRRLPLEEQVAILLADAHGYHDRESVTIMGISLPSFKLLLHRARKHLRAIAGDRCDLLESTRAVGADPPSEICEASIRPRAAVAGARACDPLHCRLGVRCCIHIPRLQALRDSLLKALDPRP
jgi:RNA polymerase sigma-70 factor, ECF subfamily